MKRSWRDRKMMIKLATRKAEVNRLSRWGMFHLGIAPIRDCPTPVSQFPNSTLDPKFNTRLIFNTRAGRQICQVLERQPEIQPCKAHNGVLIVPYPPGCVRAMWIRRSGDVEVGAVVVHYTIKRFTELHEFQQSLVYGLILRENLTRQG